MEAQRITVALIDHSAGFEASPERVRLGDLADFSADVATFFRGDGKEVDTKTLEVAIRKGSLAIETMPLLAAPRLFSDLRALLGSELLDGVEAKRRDVMERWQRAARQTHQLAYRISAPFLERPILINSESDYRADDADQWVQVERYIRGEIQDLGGATKANAHVKLPDGRGLIIRSMSCDPEDDRVRVKDDFKLLAQCDCEGLSHLISEDASTLAKYLDRARETGLAATKVVLLRGGFDAAWFENGQARLVP